MGPYQATLKAHARRVLPNGPGRSEYNVSRPRRLSGAPYGYVFVARQSIPALRIGVWDVVLIAHSARLKRSEIEAMNARRRLLPRGDYPTLWNYRALLELVEHSWEDLIGQPEDDGWRSIRRSIAQNRGSQLQTSSRVWILRPVLPSHATPIAADSSAAALVELVSRAGGRLNSEVADA